MRNEAGARFTRGEENPDTSGAVSVTAPAAHARLPRVSAQSTGGKRDGSHSQDADVLTGGREQIKVKDKEK